MLIAKSEVVDEEIGLATLLESESVNESGFLQTNLE